MSEDRMDVDVPVEQETAQVPPSKDAKPKKRRFEVKKWTAVAYWSWDQSNETCAICRNHLMEPCIECTGIQQPQCGRATGTCNHTFHVHCISKWIQSRSVCPLDNSDWQYRASD